MTACTHQSRKRIISDEVHLWCRTCGALYCFMGPIGWTWVPPKTGIVAPNPKRKGGPKIRPVVARGVGFLLEDAECTDD